MALVFPTGGKFVLRCKHIVLRSVLRLHNMHSRFLLGAHSTLAQRVFLYQNLFSLAVLGELKLPHQF